MAIRRERYDIGEELAPPYETPEGFLVVEAYVSRPGIYVYRNTREDELDGLGKEGELRRELRPDAEVTSPKSLDTYRARSITLGHPRKDGRRIRVDASNVRQFEVGTTDGPARVVNGRLAAKLVIKDKAAIAEAKARRRQVSPGHFSDIIVQKGVDPKYGRYDAIQADIEINHIALVEKARGGDSLQLRLDGEEISEDEIAESGDRSPFLAPLRSDGDDMADENNQQSEVEKLRAENETLQKRITELEGQVRLRLDAAEVEAVKQANLRADEAEQKLASVMAGRKAAVQQRVSLQRVAEQFMGEQYRCDGKDDDDIKRDVVRRLDPTLDVSAMSSARLDGHFDALVKLRLKSREDHAEVSRALGAGARNDEQAAAKKLDDDWNNTWKRPPASSQMLRKES